MMSFHMIPCRIIFLSIEDCAKDGGEEFFIEMHRVRITNLERNSIKEHSASR